MALGWMSCDYHLPLLEFPFPAEISQPKCSELPIIICHLTGTVTMTVTGTEAVRVTLMGTVTLTVTDPTQTPPTHPSLAQQGPQNPQVPVTPQGLCPHQCSQ